MRSDLAVEVNGKPVARDELPALKVLRRDRAVFMDGSYVAPCTGYQRAAGALVQLDPGSEEPEVVVAFLAPADWGHSAAAAEHLCVAVLDHLGAAGVTAYTKCASVMTAARRGIQYAEGPKRLWAAVWRYLAWAWAALGKVKAHLTSDRKPRSGASEGLWAGNAVADNAAKERARRALAAAGGTGGDGCEAVGAPKVLRGRGRGPCGLPAPL